MRVSIHLRVSTEVDFWNSAEIWIFSELVYTSVEFRVKKLPYTEFRKKDEYYREIN
jgi:hypothetical protein